MSDETPTPRPSRSFAIYAEAVRSIVVRLEAMVENGQLDNEGQHHQHEARNLQIFYDTYMEGKIGTPPLEDRRSAGARVLALHAAVTAYLQARGLE